MKLLILFLLATLAHGQRFDRLELRPRATGLGGWEPGTMRFYDSQWPETAVESLEWVDLQSLASVERYTMTLPVAAPGVRSCILVDPDGRMYFEPSTETACRSGRESVRMGDVVLGTAITGSATFHVDRASENHIGNIDPYFVEAWGPNAGVEAGLIFAVPEGGLSDPPILRAWAYSSSAIGTNPLEARVACMSPGSLSPFGTVDFDNPNGKSFSPGQAGRLHLVEFTLSNDDDMQPGDLCLLGIRPTSDFNITFFLWMEII